MKLTRKISSTLIGMLIFSGVPWGIWSFTDVAGYFGNPARLAYTIMMAVLSILVVIFVPDEGRSQGKGQNPMKQHKISLFLLQTLPILILVLAPYSDHHNRAVMADRILIRLAGLLLTFLGFFLMNWSVMALGKQFSVEVTIQENHQLVTNGPYRYIRHPRYLGILIFFCGISIVFRSWLGLILMGIVLIALIWRIRDEEKLMFQEFQGEWETYKSKSSALIPFIY